MKQPFALSLALLLLFPCWLSAQDVTEQATQAPDASPTPTEVSTPAEIPAPTEVPQAVDSSSATNNYAITSYEPATASPTDSSQAIDSSANALPETTPEAIPEASPAAIASSEPTPVAELAPAIKEEKPAEPLPTQNKPKRFWGGITVGITYNDYFSTKFGLDDLKSGKDYKLSVSGADDLLSNFWGVGFKVGMSCMFIASPYFNLRSDLNIAFRQGSGKTNASIILDWKDSEKADEKSDLEIEYSATQLNIDLPFLARVSIPNAVYFEAGPMFSFNVYSKSESKITDIYGTEKFEEKGGLNAFEFDLAAGIGISRSIGKSMLDFDLRFVFGMTRISDSSDAPKTWQGQLNITYWFL
ncbi:MAG: outer membrane beta-barrel protein [Fibrobacter sp.]|nr:outer membrane beta-barrel protein [Fibrobacter sp.]